jgi:hypothetical protein
MHIKRKPDIFQLQTKYWQRCLDWYGQIIGVNEANSHAVTFQAVQIPWFAVENCIPS